jgi:ABC-type Fe3+ transport system substrate-binding protein
MHRVRFGLLGGLLASLLVGLACGPGAPPAPGSSAAAPAPSGATSPAAVGAPVSDTAYRQQVIDAARAEGQVNAAIQATFTQDTIQQLEAAIEREYGVRIRINFTSVGNYGVRAAELLTEVAAGATPSYDLYQGSDTTAASLWRAGAVEEVNWAPLLRAGTPPAMVAPDNGHVVMYTDHFGLMSDPTVIPDADVPRSLKDLGNPRWRGKVMLFVGAGTYIPWVVLKGRDDTLAALRAAVQNGAVVDTFPNEFTRFAAKEYPLILISGSFFRTAQLRGIPARFTPLDVSVNHDHLVAVGRRAAHPNAAKLLGAVLAGPDGQRISAEAVGVGSRYYDSSSDHQLEQEAVAAGFPTFHWQTYPEALALSLSPEGDELSCEIDRIFKGG